MDNSGICYTLSGNKKKYEPDLFKAQLNVAINEWCYRYDSDDSRTLVFSYDPGEITDHFYAYLPYGNLIINHNIQANGEEDHYRLTGNYTNPPTQWSPPAGLDGPFDNPYHLKYPYYRQTVAFSYYVSIFYGGRNQNSTTFVSFGDSYYYGNKK